MQADATAMFPVSTRVRLTDQPHGQPCQERIEHQRRRLERRERAREEIEAAAPVRLDPPECAPWQKNAARQTAAR